MRAFCQFSLFVFFLYSATASLSAQNHEELFQKGNKAYQKKEYAEALQYYHQIEEKGMHSAELYENIGNGYFRIGDYPKAILYYEKGLRLNPKGLNLHHNLEISRSRITDQFESLPDFFFYGWIQDIVYTLPLWFWNSSVILFFALFLLLFAFYLISRIYTSRKLYFRCAFISLFLCILSWGGSFVYYQLSQKQEGIISARKTNVLSAPENESKVKFTIHEGSKVSLLDELDAYLKVRLSNGNTGWITKKDLIEI